jgi:putative endonuclease
MAVANLRHVDVPGKERMDRQPCVYLLASGRNGTLYCGVTSDLVQRAWQHREHLVPGFTRRYGVTRLVWYEQHVTMESAITREKRIKRWSRGWKLGLIDAMNPSWRDLWPDITGAIPKADVHGPPPARG